jgi:hypothetical protein
MAGSRLVVPITFFIAMSGNYLILLSATRLALFDNCLSNTFASRLAARAVFVVKQFTFTYMEC